MLHTSDRCKRLSDCSKNRTHHTEPSGEGEDAEGRFQYSDWLRTQTRKGNTALLVTHYLYEIPTEVERVIFLREGKLLADGQNRRCLPTSR